MGKENDDETGSFEIEGAFVKNIGRRSQALVALVFEDIGGLKRFAQWAEENPTDYYTKIFTKLIPKHVEVEDKRSIEDYLLEIDGEVLEAESPPPLPDSTPSEGGRVFPATRPPSPPLIAGKSNNDGD